MKQETKTKSIRLDATEDTVKLSVTVGNGHPSFTTLYKNGSKIAELTDPYADYVLGTKKSLIGSDLLITTSVHDLPETPDEVLVSHKLNDSASMLISSDFQIKVDDGEVAICSTQIYFLTK